MPTPNRNGDVLDLKFEIAFVKGIIVPARDMCEFPSPFCLIHRIQYRYEDGLFEGLDRSGEPIALLPIESVAILHCQYGVKLGAIAESKLKTFLKPKEAGLKSLASGLIASFGVVGPWKMKNEAQALSSSQVETLSSEPHGEEVKFSPGAL